MRPYSVSYTPADDDTDGYANDVNTTAGLPFTLAATTVGDSLAHKVIITPSGSVTGNYALTGTDADGKAQTETLATNTTNAVTSTKYFKTLTQVLAPAGIGANTVDIGWTDVGLSQTLPIEWRSVAAAALYVDVSGTINFTVNDTIENIWNYAAPSQDADFANISALASKTADTAGSARVGAVAIQLLINSLTAGATIQLQISQASQSWS